MKTHWNTPACLQSADAAKIAADLAEDAGPKARDDGGATPWDRARLNNAIKDSDALRRLRTVDRVEQEQD